jgi:hypothetical protein
MLQVSKSFCVMVVVAGVAAFAAADGRAADLAPIKSKLYRQVSITHDHVAIARVRDCGGGWWQSQSWGRVRPRYVMRCRYIIVRN